MFETDTRSERLFPYRSIRQASASRPAEIHSVRPGDTVLSALRVPAGKNPGVTLVLDRERRVGAMSERDYARKAILAGRRAEETAVGEIMSREVVAIDLDAKFGDGMNRMNEHPIRHLPVRDAGRIICVLSLKDGLREAVAHREKVIMALERERMSVFNPAC